MSWFSNLKMRSKVLGGFVIVLAMMTGLGVLAMTSLSKVETVTQEINGNALPGIIALTEIRGMLKEHRLNLVSTLAVRDEQSILAHEKTAAELQGKVDLAFRDYQRFLVDDTDRGLYDAAGKSLGVYMAGQLQVVGAMMNSFLVSLYETMSQVAMTSTQVASASEELSASSEQLASGTQQQAAAVEETAASLEKVEDGSALVKRVTDFMAEITSANLEQASGIDQLNKAIAQMDQVVQSNSSQTDELSSTASALSSQAEQLRAMVDRFQLDGSGAPAGASAPLASQAISMTRLAHRPRTAKRPRPAPPPQAGVPAPRTSDEFPGAQVFEQF